MQANVCKIYIQNNCSVAYFHLCSGSNWFQKMWFKIESTGRILRLLRFRGHFRPFHCRIFVTFVFDKISLVTIKKRLGDYFQQLHFWNQWVLLIKMHWKMCYLFDIDLKRLLRPGVMHVCGFMPNLNEILDNSHLMNKHEWYVPGVPPINTHFRFQFLTFLMVLSKRNLKLQFKPKWFNLNFTTLIFTKFWKLSNFLTCWKKNEDEKGGALI